jgi:lipopolysaccharide/colanic/teichoic acid biosynthesis glycosyltransferase
MEAGMILVSCCKETSIKKAGMRSKINIDQVIALFLLPVALTLLALLYIPVVALQGRPFLFASQRMRSVDRGFSLYKIRTMNPPNADGEERVLCAHQARRVTGIGAFLRRTRLDELPQIFNVIRGDIRFIGPRPPLRRYVVAFPDLYAEVLRETPPGITGLATVMLHRREERLLSACRNPAEADSVYRTQCIPIKARLDLIYRDRRGFRLNLLILFRTVSRLFLGSGSARACARNGEPSTQIGVAGKVQLISRDAA